jgi:hypothetical protein
MPLSPRALAGVFIVEAAAALLAATLIVDVRAHTSEEEGRGINQWGYRGPARRTPLGVRVAVLGGAAAYGYGVDWPASFPGYLESLLNRYPRRDPTRAFEVLNLSAVGDGAASYAATLRAYAYLEPYAAVLYDGFAGVGLTGSGGARSESRLFRATGYFPIAGFLAGGASLSAADRAVVDPILRDDATGDVSCTGDSRAYCSAIADAVAAALGRVSRVAVVTPPYISRRHEAQQQSLAAMLAERFGGDPRVRYFNLGKRVDVRNRVLSFDGVHLTARGNEAAAKQFAAPLIDFAEPR